MDPFSPSTTSSPPTFLPVRLPNQETHFIWDPQRPPERDSEALPTKKAIITTFPRSGEDRRNKELNPHPKKTDINT